MRGFVFTLFLEMVEENFSPETADRIIERCELPNGGAYTGVGIYDHEEIGMLATALAEETGRTVEDLYRLLGRKMFGRFWESYPHWFDGVDSAFGFLPRLDGLLAAEVGKLYPDSDVQSVHFDCDASIADRLSIDVRSRGTSPGYAEGIIAACVDHFGDRVALRREDGPGGDTFRARFILKRRVPGTDDSRRLERRLDRERRARKEAEQLLEGKSRELYQANKKFQAAADALRRSQDRLRGIMDNVSDGIITINDSGIIDSINHAAEMIFDYPAEKVVGQPVNVLMHEPQRGEHDTYIRNYLKTGEGKFLGRGPREVRGRRRDGTEVPIDLVISQMWLGKKHLFIAAIRDITERRAREVQSRMSQKMEAMGQLTAGVAHEFNNMLVPIIGLTEIALENLPEEGVVSGNLKRVLEAAGRARALVSEILAFGRKGPRQAEPVDMPSTVRDALSLIRSTTPSTIEVLTRIDSAPAFFFGDATEIHQIMLNLVSNAVQAIGGTVGVIEIGLARRAVDPAIMVGNTGLPAGSYALLSVRDSGCGMDQATKDRMFEPFFTTKQVGKGTGMGLAMIHAIVNRSKGAIDVRSQRGKGSTFDIWLPLMAEDVAGKGKPGTDSHRGDEVAVGLAV